MIISREQVAQVVEAILWTDRNPANVAIEKFGDDAQVTVAQMKAAKVYKCDTCGLWKDIDTQVWPESEVCNWCQWNFDTE